MPELPEVETVVRTLAPSVLGKAIVKVEVFWPGSVASPDRPADFVAMLEGRQVEGVRRRAKLAILDLSGGVHLAVHLKMTGRLLACSADHVRQKHDRIIFTMDDGSKLVFNDTRKFGKCRAETPESLAEWPFYRNLGPEPLQTAPEEFAKSVRTRGARIKALLLDQTVIAGVGNIYADETLHMAGVCPSCRACDLPADKPARIHECLVQVLKKAIAENGSSINDYLDADGNAGAFQNSFKVYGRKGKACLCCGTPLKSGTVAGRTTVWCPKCQK